SLQNLRVSFESCPGSPNMFELHQYFTRNAGAKARSVCLVVGQVGKVSNRRGWLVKSRSVLIDFREALLINRCAYASIYKDAARLYQPPRLRYAQPPRLRKAGS